MFVGILLLITAFSIYMLILRPIFSNINLLDTVFSDATGTFVIKLVSLVLIVLVIIDIG